MLLFIPILVLTHKHNSTDVLVMTAGQRATDNFRVRLSRDRLCADLFGENIHGRAYSNRQVKLQLFIAAAFIFNAAKAAIRFMPSFSVLPCLTRICCRNSAHQRLRLLKQQPSYLSLYANFVLCVANYLV